MKLANRKSFRLVLSIAALLLFLPSTAKACDCAFKSSCEDFSYAPVIFIGQMIEGSEKVEKDNSTDGPFSYEAGSVHFSVEETFKGDLGAEVTISVESHKNTDCGPYGLIRGGRYVVYAYGDPEHLSTGVCTRTHLIRENKSDEDLQFLRNLPKEGTGGKLTGKILLFRDHKLTPFEDLPVILRDKENREIKTKTDAEGKFELFNLKAGTYSIKPLLPRHYTIFGSNEEVEITDRGCSTVSFEAKPAGQISGKLFDSNNHPLSLLVFLSLADPKSTTQPILWPSREDGSFELKGIPPGNYLLYIELHSNDPDVRQKYYYPGVKVQQEATIIKIGLGQQLDGYNFQVPEEFTTQTVEGQVMWPDKSLAAGIEVLLLCPNPKLPNGYILDFGPHSAVTDEHGHFKITGIKGTSYILTARFEKVLSSEDDGLSFIHSPGQTLTLENDLTNVNLVLSEAGIGNACSN